MRTVREQLLVEESLAHCRLDCSIETRTRLIGTAERDEACGARTFHRGRVERRLFAGGGDGCREGLEARLGCSCPRMRVRDVDPGFEDESRVADAYGLRGDVLERCERTIRVAALERAAGKLDLGEQRERGVARRAQDAPRIRERTLRLVHLAPTHEELAEVGPGERRVLTVARAKAVVSGAGVELGGLVPSPVGVRLDPHVQPVDAG